MPEPTGTIITRQNAVFQAIYLQRQAQNPSTSGEQTDNASPDQIAYRSAERWVQHASCAGSSSSASLAFDAER